MKKIDIIPRDVECDSCGADATHMWLVYAATQIDQEEYVALCDDCRIKGNDDE